MTEYDPKRGISVATLAYEYPSRFEVLEHAHGSDQLIYAISGLMEISSDQSMWLIPPHFALWIPARTHHRIHMPGPVSMRTLYLRTGLTARLDPRCAVLHVTPLLRELIVETVRVNQLRVRNRYECALRDLLISQIQKASPVPTFVTLPRDARAFAVAQAVLRKPAESMAMADLCAEAGVSVRTIQRVFRKEIGIDFESWRRQVRLTKAVELLVSGYSIKEVAHKVGYCQPSAFVEMFRRTFGTTPKAWMLALETLANDPPTTHKPPSAPQRSGKL
ncbi:AraC family transcriptional regulator [Tunturiibacter gelidoferens]|uniref:AraC-like DNA-binding protein n=1 Tax=Tunturiibacter gelidiferens TaxID=3069689 RepID=A0ACC5NZN4_9BACT|nr:helix-turn-helix transcriptional regulator [Edaphobacter lichenicola]MBB5339896.1 AraC-like DNA-binding protein [Edaphobacter lichenicola]